MQGGTLTTEIGKTFAVLDDIQAAVRMLLHLADKGKRCYASPPLTKRRFSTAWLDEPPTHLLCRR